MGKAHKRREMTRAPRWMAVLVLALLGLFVWARIAGRPSPARVRQPAPALR